MNPIEYLKDRLSKSLINGIESALYEFHEYSETHFVKIIPANIVDGDKFDSELSQIIVDFENEFPSEMLCFIGNDSLNKFENPIELLAQEVTSAQPTEEVCFSDSDLKIYWYPYDTIQPAMPIEGSVNAIITTVGSFSFGAFSKWGPYKNWFNSNSELVSTFISDSYLTTQKEEIFLDEEDSLSNAA